jgi:hypothetical protein
LRAFDVRTLDSTVIIDREGNIVFSDAAPTDAETLKSELEGVL